MKYTIVNLVAASDLKATLDLYNLAISIPEIEYEPEQFPGAILKLKEPKVSMLLFKNGKIICSGASSEKEIAQGIRKASKLIHEIQPEVKVQRKVSYDVVNLVATANLNLELDLFQTAMKLDNVEYEPEQFPGAILRIDDPPLTMLLFKNGKMICAGAKREYLLRKGLRKAEQIIKAIVKPKQLKRKTKQRKKRRITKKKRSTRKRKQAKQTRKRKTTRRKRKK